MDFSNIHSLHSVAFSCAGTINAEFLKNKNDKNTEIEIVENIFSPEDHTRICSMHFYSTEKFFNNFITRESFPQKKIGNIIFFKYFLHLISIEYQNSNLYLVASQYKNLLSSFFDIYIEKSLDDITYNKIVLPDFLNLFKDKDGQKDLNNTINISHIEYDIESDNKNKLLSLKGSNVVKTNIYKCLMGDPKLKEKAILKGIKFIPRRCTIKYIGDRNRVFSLSTCRFGNFQFSSNKTNHQFSRLHLIFDILNKHCLLEKTHYFPPNRIMPKTED